jgi:hypothetical protein
MTTSYTGTDQHNQQSPVSVINQYVQFTPHLGLITPHASRAAAHVNINREHGFHRLVV